jgi:hypothetical protein
MLTLNIIANSTPGKIYYTTNLDPFEDQYINEYTGPIEISKTTLIRFDITLVYYFHYYPRSLFCST